MRLSLVIGFPDRTRGLAFVKQEFRVPISRKLGTEYSELTAGKNQNNAFFAEQGSASNKSCSTRLNFNRKRRYSRLSWKGKGKTKCI